MAEYLIQDSTLTAIGNAIRAKTKKTDAILVSNLANEISGISTGVELNFDVVGGTTAPSNPTENMIWVNTDAEITGWFFSATEPTETKEGMVWFLIQTQSHVEFDALKDNGIQVYPSNVYQYINGTFVLKPLANTYQNGAWVSWRKFLYYRGDQCATLSGGWTGTGASWNGYNWGTMSCSNTASYLQMYAPSQSAGAVIANNTIDLTNISTITVTYTASFDSNVCGIRFGAFSELNTNGMKAYVNVTTTSTEKTISVNVASLTGKYIIGFLGTQTNMQTSNIRIYEIEMK